MKARYIIRHHPNLFTEILVEEDGKSPVQIEDRYSWIACRGYCIGGCQLRGIQSPTIERPEPYTEVFPWLEV